MFGAGLLKRVKLVIERQPCCCRIENFRTRINDFRFVAVIALIQVVELPPDKSGGEGKEVKIGFSQNNDAIAANIKHLHLN